VDLALHVADFTCFGPAVPSGLAAAARAAEDAGFRTLTLMDHWFQMDQMAPATDPMLDGYTALGFLAGQTERLQLGLLVTGVTYRHPGLLAKTLATLDVLSGGRALLGIGAAWYEREHAGLGVPFPPVAERFERLEETLRICRQMWSADDGPYEGTHYRLGATVNVPQPLRRPPVLVGGGGEKKTLRLVAQYADACNLFPGPELERKLDVLRGHCADVGRDYDEIEKTVMLPLDTGDDGEHVDALLAQLRTLSGLGVTLAQGWVPRVWEPGRLELIGREIVPAAAQL
jgi:F420-dependent oxidoreductase-like protein